MRVQEFNARRDELRKNLKAQGMTQSAAREESWRLARKEFAPEGTVEDGNAIGSALDLPAFEYRSQRAYAAAASPENQLVPPPSASALTMLQYAKQHLGAFIENLVPAPSPSRDGMSPPSEPSWRNSVARPASRRPNIGGSKTKSMRSKGN